MAKMIVFFDGVCGLCNGVVDVLLSVDRRGKLRFAPLQGQIARSQLEARDTETLDSIVVRTGAQTFRESEAVIMILKELGGVYRLLGFLASAIPRRIRNHIYALVARHRYRLFGKRAVCRRPTQEERQRFLEES